MPTTNARRHVIPAGADQSFTRATIFSAFGNSIRDIVPVATVTDRAALISDLTTAGQAPSATKPLVVYRADAPGMHRLEYTTNGTVWLPASGSLIFASKSAADSFGTSNSGLLSVGDECRVGALRYLWSGTAWVPMFAAVKVLMNTPQPIAASTFTTLLWDTEVFDIGDFRVPGSPGDLVAPVKGIYQVNATGGFSAVFTGRVLVQFLKNGAVEYGGNLVPTAGNDDVSAQASTLVPMNAGDVLRVQIFQGSANTQNTSTSAYARPTATLQLMATN